MWPSFPAEGLEVQDIPNAGRGVIAKRDIPEGTLVLESEPPAASVIFRQYRKEVCAQCLLYDRGRTLKVRHPSTGTVFCTTECRTAWLDEEGELGLRAWENLHAFVQSRAKDVADGYDDLTGQDDCRPGPAEVDAVWEAAEVGASRAHRKKSDKTPRSPKTVDPDILSYLLSAHLAHTRHPTTWLSSLTALAQDATPYRNRPDLQAHADSYLHLLHHKIVPSTLPTITPALCRLAISAASHNAFGIRSSSASDPDASEYMGYSLHPSASYFNHACAPNVSKVRVGRRWVFTAARDVAVGEQCCISYMGGDEEGMGVAERRERLKAHWGFVCACDRCVTEAAAETKPGGDAAVARLCQD